MSDHCDHCHPSCHAELARDWHSDWAGLGSWRKGECPTCAERAAIAAWLRGLRVSAGENITTDAANRMDDIATWIERGEHLRGDDE